MTSLLLCALVAAVPAGQPGESVTAIVNARVHPVDGPVIEDGILLMAGKTIAAVGPRTSVAVPPGARVVDAGGGWVTPGFVDSEGLTGLFDVSLEAESREVALDDRYPFVRAAFLVLDGLNPRAVAIPVARAEGVTAAVLAPIGGLVSGQGAVIRLAGTRVDDMAVGPAGIYVSMAGEGRQAAYGARGGVLLKLRELFDDVRQYMRRREAFERNQMRRVAASRLDMEALIPVVERKLPLVIEAHRASDIQAALAFARDEKLRIVLRGCEEGWMVADEIALAQVPVVVSALANLPRAFEALGARSDNAALLAKAGVKLAVSPREKNHHSRPVRFEAGNAVTAGLPWPAALAAVTRVPAEIFGVSEKIGSLARGKSADIVVWSGDPFEPLTRVRHLFIEGREHPSVSRQTELRERYRARSSSEPKTTP